MQVFREGSAISAKVSFEGTDQLSEDVIPINARAALLGHDIRNAVADIIGGLTLADLSSLDPNSRQQLQRVRSAGEQLARLSDEVLALVTGESTVEEDERNLALKPFLDDLHARWSAHAQGKSLKFGLEAGSDLPQVIGTNRGALERILTNLIGNSMKHTDAGEVTLSVSMRERETLSFAVRDTGHGFSDAALARLFEPGGRPPESETPGTGLGLHIVHELCDQMNARMEVHNRSLGGAEVVILVPRASWAPGVNAPSAAATLPDLSGKCVLVAEDNPTNQLLMRQMLDTLGADYRIASDGQEAWELLQEQHFNLALIDIEMPRMSGLDLIRAVRLHERGTDAAEVLPVLAITAYVLSANRDEIYESGADGILAKPIMSIEAFGEAISGVLTKGEKTARVTVPTQNTPALNEVNLDRLLALAGDENGQELLERLTQDFQTVKTGVEEGMRISDYALLRARTHVLISLAGAIGADHLQAMAETVNIASHDKDSSVTRAMCPQVLQQIDMVLTRLDREFHDRFGANSV
ncbi:ATP-binding response regulator [Actibacterium lipolyticum]|uniref:histidine kinase n=1 Tax=Actibacterium lipolyticum TaxID=1524263 RepID=A0A238JN61_9RHOB|nr:response regulator [Actibacterium lipolyticum]SMX32108.1 Aerobic respiration control sensor protein ArcB [Actibacterium lipolyticum]